MAAKKTAAKKTAPVQTEKITDVKETVKVEKELEAAKETTVKEETVVEEKKPVAKKPAAKKTVKKAVKTTFVVQAASKEVSMEEAVARVKDAWTSTGNKETDLKEIAIYVKPEENSIYYVVNGDVTGRVDF